MKPEDFSVPQEYTNKVTLKHYPRRERFARAVAKFFDSMEKLFAGFNRQKV